MSGRRIGFALVLALAATLWLAPPAAAEPYLAGFLGGALTQDTDVDSRVSVSGFAFLDGTLQDVELDTALAFGAKAGYFFERTVLGGQVGVELEVAHFRPDVPAQTVRFAGTLMGQPFDGRLPVQDAELELTTIGLSALYRLPAGRLQPYGGVGVDLVIGRFSTSTTPLDANRTIEATDVQPGLHALAGARFFLTRHLALFAEYKFLHTGRLTFRATAGGTSGGTPVTERAIDRADLSTHLLVGGISFHW